VCPFNLQVLKRDLGLLSSSVLSRAFLQLTKSDELVHAEELVLATR